MVIGINGHSHDAVWKARSLHDRKEASVDLVITPSISHLEEYFAAFPSVRSVWIDSEVSFKEGHGEESKWTVPLDLSLTYPRYPDKWIVNFVGSYTDRMSIERSAWFGSCSFCLPSNRKTTEGPPMVWFDAAADWSSLKSTLAAAFPEVVQVSENPELSVVENLCQAAAATLVISSFGMYMALFAAVGIRVITPETKALSEKNRSLFTSFGETVVSGNSLWLTVHHALMEKLPKLKPQWNQRSLTFGIPTICGADMLKNSVPVLLEQMQEADRLIILDNGKQNLSQSLANPKLQIMHSTRNRGVAGSWNDLLRRAWQNKRTNWVVLLNDDVQLGPSQISDIKAELLLAEINDQWFLNGPYYWSVIALNRKCVDEIGWFDENFFPAYFEDNDYAYRIRITDSAKRYKAGNALLPAVRKNSVTLRRLPHIHRFEENKCFYIQKWGGLPGHETCTQPFMRSQNENECQVCSVLTCFNELECLPDQIALLRKERIYPFVIDNGSTDGSWEWLKQNNVDSVRFDTGDRFDLPALQRKRMQIIHHLRPKWVIYGDVDEYNILDGGVRKQLERADASGFNAIRLESFNFFNTGEPDDNSSRFMHRYFFCKRRYREMSGIIRIHRFHRSMIYEADTVRFDGLRPMRVFAGVNLNYGDCKPPSYRIKIYERRVNAWRAGMSRELGGHYRQGKACNWLWQKDGLKDIRETRHWPRICEEMNILTQSAGTTTQGAQSMPLPQTIQGLPLNDK